MREKCDWLRGKALFNILKDYQFEDQKYWYGTAVFTDIICLKERNYFPFTPYQLDWKHNHNFI